MYLLVASKFWLVETASGCGSIERIIKRDNQPEPNNFDLSETCVTSTEWIPRQSGIWYLSVIPPLTTAMKNGKFVQQKLWLPYSLNVFFSWPSSLRALRRSTSTKRGAVPFIYRHLPALGAPCIAYHQYLPCFPFSGVRQLLSMARDLICTGSPILRVTFCYKKQKTHFKLKIWFFCIWFLKL
jgi:hypothetical protein